MSEGQPIKVISIHDRRLRYLLPTAGGVSHHEVILPFGVGVGRGDFVFAIQSSSQGEPILVACPKRGPRLVTRLAPTFAIKDFICEPDTNQQYALRFWVVVSDLDRFNARQLIEREHYLIAPSRGMFLACAFSPRREEQAMRQRALKRVGTRAPHIDSAVLHGKPGGIVGVAVLDTLYHGNPKQGRAEFATSALGHAKWLSWDRGDVVQRLRIAWASRFAVDSLYRGLGIGTRLALHLKTVARHYRAPAANFLEVITTEERRSDRAAGLGANNFLVQAGYRQAESLMKSAPMRRMELRTGFERSVPAVKRYYFADLRHGIEIS